MNINSELNKIGLTPESYEEFLQDCADKINGVNDIDWSEIIEKYNLPYDRRRISESMGRNILGGSFVREFYKNKVIGKTSDEALKDMITKEQDIYKAKRKLQDERNELNKLLRDEARYEENVRIFTERLESIAKDRYPFHIPQFNYDNSSGIMIVMLSDLHIGLETKDYNTEIVQKRLAQYLFEIGKISQTHKIKRCVVVCLGDLISGSAHITIQISNRENVVDQVMTACELISDFVYELGSIFDYVEFCGVPGNHSRIEKNADDALLGERLDNIIPWFVYHMLSNQGWFLGDNSVKHDTYTELSVGDMCYTLIHGDYDGINDTAIQKLCSYMGYFPYAVLMGHMHHSAMNEVAGVKVIQSGCLFKADEYTERRRLRGIPSQTVLVCNDTGKIQAIYPIELN